MGPSLPILGPFGHSLPPPSSAQSSLSCTLEALAPFWEILVRSGRRQGAGLMGGGERFRDGMSRGARLPSRTYSDFPGLLWWERVSPSLSLGPGFRPPSPFYI